MYAAAAESGDLPGRVTIDAVTAVTTSSSGRFTNSARRSLEGVSDND
jgi:hypothetical protein